MYRADWEVIGRNVKSYRRRNQLLQAAVAKEVGITQTHLSNMEAGRVRINLEHLMTMANMFNCTLDDLVLAPDVVREPEITNDNITEKDLELAVRLLKAIKSAS